MRDIFQIVL